MSNLINKALLGPLDWAENSWWRPFFAVPVSLAVATLIAPIHLPRIHMMRGGSLVLMLACMAVWVWGLVWVLN